MFDKVPEGRLVGTIRDREVTGYKGGKMNIDDTIVLPYGTIDEVVSFAMAQIHQ